MRDAAQRVYAPSSNVHLSQNCQRRVFLNVPSFTVFFWEAKHSVPATKIKHPRIVAVPEPRPRLVVSVTRDDCALCLAGDP